MPIKKDILNKKKEGTPMFYCRKHNFKSPISDTCPECQK